MAETRRVIFDFLGRTGDLDRALDHTSRRLADLDGQFTSSNRGLVSIGAAAAAVAGPVLAAGAAFVGFAAVAAPSIGKVVSAQQNLAESWATLSENQRASALQVKGLTDSFGKLSDAYQPQALAAFNTILGAVNDEMPTFQKLVSASAPAVQGLADKFAGFVRGPLDEFLHFSARTGPAALGLLGDSMTTTGELALTLVQDTAPLGLSLLQVANGGLGMANALAQANPALTQLAIGTLLLRGPIGAVAGGVSGMASRFRDAAGAGQGLSRSAKAMNLVGAAGPPIWITAAAAVGYFAVKAFTAKNAADKMVEAMAAQNDAVGNNVDGYRALIAEIHPKLTSAQDEWERRSKGANRHNTDNVLRMNELEDATKAYKNELKDANNAISNIEKGSRQLSATYGITEAQAVTLANAAGVDLTNAFDKGGQMTAEATSKIRNYRAAVEAAADPTRLLKLALDDASNASLSLKDRTTALATAFDAVFNPTLAAFNATNQLKEGYARLSEQMAKHKGTMDGSSEASRQLRQAFGAQLGTVRDLYTATFNQTRSTDAASKAVRDQIPVLMALAGNNRQARNAVQALADVTGNATVATNVSRRAFLNAADAMGLSKNRANELWAALQKLRSKSIDLRVDAEGRYNWGGGTRRAGGGHPLAVGGPVPAIGPNASRAYDSVPAMLRVDEHVWTPEEVDKVGGHDAMYRLREAARRGMLQGYAKGGPVGSMSASARISSGASIRPITSMIHDGTTAMLTYMAGVLAESFKKSMSGGGVVAAARSQIGLPYSWGGGGKGGPSYGIGRGAGTYGFDCSGLTEYAWWKGRRVSIGGWTGEQHPNSTPIGGPRPGALGFSASTGHVGLASDRPGYVIEAPYTGSFVREVPRSFPDWRWPNGAKFATGGKVIKWGNDFAGGYAVRGDRAMMEMAGIAGGRKRGRGGPVAPNVPYLVGEHGVPEVFTPATGGHVTPAGSVVVQNIRIDVHVPLAAQKGAVGREINEYLAEYKRTGGKVVTG